MFITTVITNFMQIDHILILNSEREGVGSDVCYGCGVGGGRPSGQMPAIPVIAHLSQGQLN